MNKQGNWTPGPWEAYRARFTEYGVRSAIGIDITTEQTEANARLIAAAPDLAEALDGLLDYCEAECLVRAPLAAARAALAKARGEDQ